MKSGSYKSLSLDRDPNPGRLKHEEMLNIRLQQSVTKSTLNNNMTTHVLQSVV